MMNLNTFQWRSLKTRVTLFTLSIFLFSIWSLSFYASLMLREDIQRLLGEQQFSTVSIIAADIDVEMKDRLNALVKVAERLNPAIMSSAASTQTFLENRPTLQHLFNGGTFVTGIDGTATASLPVSAGRVGVNYMERDHIASALKEGKPKVSRPAIGKMLRAPVIGFAVPVRDNAGNIIGALAGVTNLAQPNFLDKISENRYGRTGGYFLVAPQYRLNITSTDKSRIMQPLATPGTNPAIDRFVNGYEGSLVSVDQLGAEVLVSAKHIPVPGWKLVAALPTQEAFAPIHAVQQRIFLATFFLTLLAGGLTWWMLRRQLSPMLTAIKTLAILSDSNQPPQPLPISTQDEIGQLIGAFNRLLKTLVQNEYRMVSLLDISHYPFTSEQEFLDHALNEIISLTSSSIGYIYFYDEQNRLFTLNTWSQEVMLECRVVEPQTTYDLDSTGIWGEAVRQRKPIMVNDYPAHNPLKKGMPEGHVSLRRFLTVPVQVEGAIVAVVGVANKESEYNDADVMQLTLFMNSVWKITAHKRAEAEKVNLEAQFQQTQKLESLGVLAGGIAHDFNNILSIILGHCYIMQEEIDSGLDPKNHINTIIISAERAAEICQHMLSYAGSNELVQTRMSLWLLVDESVKMLTSAIKKNVGIELDLKYDVPDIIGDTAQIQQIIMNIIINAAEAIGDNNGIIKVALNKTTIAVDQMNKDFLGASIKPGNYACLTVSDNGCGMDVETQQRMFEPFYTTKFTGRGLGMSAVLGIIKSHDGSLQLSSAQGVGTTLRIYFPSSDVSDIVTVAPASALFPLAKGRGTILLVDDEEPLRIIGSAILKAMGFVVMTAADGREALNIYNKHESPIDLILLDVLMPEMGGFETYHRLREISPSLPIVICSGYNLEEILNKVVGDQCAGVIQKPYKPDQLRDILMKLIDKTE